MSSGIFSLQQPFQFLHHAAKNGAGGFYRGRGRHIHPGGLEGVNREAGCARLEKTEVIPAFFFTAGKDPLGQGKRGGDSRSVFVHVKGVVKMGDP